MLQLVSLAGTCTTIPFRPGVHDFGLAGEGHCWRMANTSPVYFILVYI
jgi:hypothetical protein